jgi:5-methylcytosine-specific restriction endonuclease McrA
MDHAREGTVLENYMTTPAAEEQLKFITNIQRILEEGSFVATYKFALIMSLADFAVEKGDDSGEPLQLTTRDIAESFAEYYWRQAVPYAHGNLQAPVRVLKQGTGPQPIVLSRIMELHNLFNGSLSAARNNTLVWGSLLNKVAATITQMPLWKLQVVGRTIMPFLYEQHGSGNIINLYPGVVYNFRKFYDLIRNLVHGAWIRHIRMLNVDVLGESDLAEFLFGAERTILPGLRAILKSIQSGDCFYCNGRLREGGDIDHFIPWSRYPLDLGHNFVLAHSVCNRSKRDFLAAPCHLENWQKRNQFHGQALAQEFDACGILHNQDATEKITYWAYSQAETAGSNLWVSKDDVMPIDDSWRLPFMNLTH